MNKSIVFQLYDGVSTISILDRSIHIEYRDKTPIQIANILYSLADNIKNSGVPDRDKTGKFLPKNKDELCLDR